MNGASVKVSAKAARAALGNLLDAIRSGTQRVVENVGAAAEKAARATTTFKDRTGELRRSIKHANTGLYGVRLRAMARHAIFVEAGTRPHPIAARRVPYLVFKVAGRWVRKKSVRHPGTTATHFMRDAGRQLEPVLRHNLEAVTNTAILRHNR